MVLDGRGFVGQRVPVLVKFRKGKEGRMFACMVPESRCDCLGFPFFGRGVW